MKSKEVLSVLRITRPTLCKYVKEDKIKATKLSNGQYDYDEKSVYALLNKDIERKTVLYCRVSNQKNKKDLANQEHTLKQYCFSNGIKIHSVYSDIASGLDFEKRTNFFKMLDEIISGKVENVVITYKDRLSRIGFNLFLYLFNKYNCKITVLSEVSSYELDSEEVLGDISDLLKGYSTRLFSKKTINKIKEVLSTEE